MTTRFLGSPILLIVAAVVLLGPLAWVTETQLLDPARLAEASIGPLVKEIEGLRERRAGVEREIAALRQPSAFAATPLTYAAAGGDPGVTRLQEEIHGLILATNGVLVSSQAGNPSHADGNLTQIQVLVRARFDEADLLEFLGRVGALTPLVGLSAMELGPAGNALDGPPLDFTGVFVAFESDAV